MKQLDIPFLNFCWMRPKSDPPENYLLKRHDTQHNVTQFNNIQYKNK
jgi:hypothetical protein